MEKKNSSRLKTVKKILNYMVGGFFIKSQTTAIVAAVVLLGFAELFAYFGDESRRTFTILNLYLAVILVSLILIRLAVALRVERIMYTNFEARAKEEQVDEKKEEGSAEAKPVEKRASAMPALDLARYPEVLADKRFVDLGEKAARQARSTYLLALGRDVAASVGYIVISIVAASAFPALQAIIVFGVQIGGIGLLLAFLRFLFHFRGFRPRQAGTDKTRHPVFELIRALSQPKNQTIFFYYILLQAVVWVIVGLTEKDFGSALGILLLVGLHYALVRFMRPKNERNIKLLVLRTFQINSNTSFTFEKLMRFWKHVGSMFTIVDSSFLLHTYRFFSPRNLVYLILLAAPGVIGLFQGGNPGLVILYTFLILGAIVAIEISLVNLNVIKSQADFVRRLERFLRSPRDPGDLTFKNMPTVNYGNVWDKSVLELVGRSDAVLMDLRGFSEAKKGCEFEINLLMDHKHIEQILFLISARDQANFELITKTIYAKWEYQQEQSPNLALQEPKLQVYLAIDESDSDVQGLYDRLLAVAESGQGV